jgi:pimeloyl-ACP methyl ester carboxylesterase
MMRDRPSARSRWWWLLLLIPILAAVGYGIWAQAQYEPMPEALAALESDEQVQVTVPRALRGPGWLIFLPVGQKAHSGLVLYPGGFVDPRAYAPTARAIAAEGHLVVIVPMPLNLAVLAPNRATRVIDATPEVERWAVGGHSLGGAMAARYAQRSPEVAQGLALWAAYPAEGEDLSARDLAVASIYGTRDGLATQPKIDASRPLLPQDTAWTAIEGGNHAQFGWYGPQSGDQAPTLSREEQQEQIVAATAALLERVEGW